MAWSTNASMGGWSTNASMGEEDPTPFDDPFPANVFHPPMAAPDPAEAFADYPVQFEPWIDPAEMLQQFEAHHAHLSGYFEQQRPGLLETIEDTSDDYKAKLVVQKMFSDISKTRFRGRYTRTKRPHIASLVDFFAYLNLCSKGKADMPSAQSSDEWCSKKGIARLQHRLTTMARDNLDKFRPDVNRAIELKDRTWIKRFIRQLHGWYPHMKIDCEEDFLIWLHQYIKYRLAKSGLEIPRAATWGHLGQNKGRVSEMVLDTGCSQTNIKQELITRCQLEGYGIDTNFCHRIRGMGVQKIVGRMFGVPTTFKDSDEMPAMDIEVLEVSDPQSTDLLIGMDYQLANKAIHYCRDKYVYFLSNDAVCRFEKDPDKVDPNQDNCNIQ